jgi:hypothetical protein
MGFYNIYEWRKIGEVGVDAGLLMIGDPCYFIGEEATAKVAYPTWDRFLDKQELLVSEGVTQMNYVMGHAGLGVVASTRYGDGVYPVYGLYMKEGKDNRPLAMLVVTDEETVLDLPDVPAEEPSE